MRIRGAVLLVATATVVNSCGGDERGTAVITPPAEAIVEVSQDCGPAAPDARFTRATNRHPNLVIVRLSGGMVAPADAERILRDCLTTVARTHKPTSDVIGTVWLSPSGRGDDYVTVPVPDGSSQMIYQPEGGEILTWKQRWAAAR